FLVYQAYLDTFIIGEQPFSISYDTGLLLINDRPIPEPHNSWYIRKIETMLNEQHIPRGLQTFTIHAKQLSIPPIELIDKPGRAKERNTLQNGSYFNSLGSYMDIRNQCRYKTG